MPARPPTVGQYSIDAQGNIVIPTDGARPAPLPMRPSSESPQVPQEFIGCWEGSDIHMDVYQQFGGARTDGKLGVTYRLCFQRTGAGPLTVTFNNSAPIDNFGARMHRVRNFTSQITVTGASATQVNLHEISSFDENAAILFVIPDLLHSATTTTISDMQATLSGDKLLVAGTSADYCSGAPDIGCNGQVWHQGTWHATLHRAAD
jgi:hypothetical protein